MSRIIRKYDNRNEAIVDAGNQLIPDVYFNLVRCRRGERVTMTPATAFEVVAVVLSGTCDIEAGGQRFGGIGRRNSVWDGKADSVYAGRAGSIAITALTDGVEVALAGGLSSENHEPFRIAPAEVESVVVGSSGTKSRREIFHILGQNAAGRAGNLLVSELYCEDGCWSGYPPHKHDQTRAGETNHAELYHYRFDPPTGFGAQIDYAPGREPAAVMTFDGDTFLIPNGYHPTVTSPGHKEYIFTILVGREQRGLVQYFDPAHGHLASYIPGLDAMRDKFK